MMSIKLCFRFSPVTSAFPPTRRRTQFVTQITTFPHELKNIRGYQYQLIIILHHRSLPLHLSMEPRPISAYQLALGCMAGAFCGDAAGGLLDPTQSSSESAVSDALQLRGGGKLGLGPGQITGKCELTLALAYALADSPGTLNLDVILKRYMQWAAAPPLDVVVRAGEDSSRTVLSWVDAKKLNAVSAKAAALDKNSEVEDNECLARMAPLAVWTHKLSDPELERAVRAAVVLTHPNIVVQEACVCYCLCIKHLMATRGNSVEAFARTQYASHVV